MLESDRAENLLHALRDVYFLLNSRKVIDEHLMSLIRIVTHNSWCLGITLKGKNHRLKKKEAIKIEAIVGLSDDLETLVKTLTKPEDLKSEGREKILKIIKPLLWIKHFLDSKLHVELMDYEKRKGRPRKGRETLRDPNEILLLYSECCFDIQMGSEERIIKENETPKNTNAT